MSGIKGKHIALGVVVILAVVLGSACIKNVSSGEYVRYQQADGTHEWIVSPGINFIQPLVSTLTTYQETTTIAFSDNEDTRDAASQAEGPALLKFADGYKGHGEFTIRFRLSPDPALLEQMHIAVKNQRNLIGNTMLPASIELLNQTANQFTGSGYAQGGKGEFKSRLDDQAKHGMLSVKRVRKEVDSNVADTSDEGDRKQNKTTKVYEYVMETQLLPDGVTEKRTALDISQYGIKVAQVTMGDFVESKELGDFLSDRRKKERESRNRIDAQRVERENTITIGLKGETDRIRAQNAANMVKDAAVIKATQAVELANKAAEREVIEREKVASLAIIDKTRQLQEAKANEGIQKAAATAAKHEATAIKLVGLAQAAVKKADYQAVDKEVLALEVQRVTSLALYRSNMVINMPDQLVSGGGDSNAGSLETFTSLAVLKQLGSTTVK